MGVGKSAFLSAVVLLVSAPALSDCYSNNLPSHSCRLKAGDAWCRERSSENVYAYADRCLREKGLGKYKNKAREATADSDVSRASSRSSHTTSSSSDDALLGAAVLAAGAAALLGAIFGFGGDDDSVSSTYSSSSSSSLKYGCKFYCEGQFGNSRSKEFRVNTPESNSADAQNYVKRNYESTCKKFPFYSGGGGVASVGFPRCETYYYE